MLFKSHSTAERGNTLVTVSQVKIYKKIFFLNSSGRAVAGGGGEGLGGGVGLGVTVGGGAGGGFGGGGE